MRPSASRALVGGALAGTLVVGSARAAEPVANVHFESNVPDLQIRYDTGATVPIPRGRGGLVLDQAAVFAPICEAPCYGHVRAGAYRLAASRRDGPISIADDSLYLGDGSSVRATYHDHSSLRATGLALGVLGVPAGVLLVLAGHDAKSEPVCVDTSCVPVRRDDVALVAVGAGVALVGVIALVGAGLVSDSVTFTVLPATLGGGAAGREGLGGIAPNGLAATLRF